MKQPIHFKKTSVTAIIFALLSLPFTSFAGSYPLTPIEAAIVKSKAPGSQSCDILPWSITEVEELVAAGAPVNEKDAAGNTALTQAISENDIAATLFLLEHGAESTLLNNQGVPVSMQGMHGDNNKGVYSTTEALNLVWAAQGLPPGAKKFFGESVQNQFGLALAYSIPIPVGYTEEQLWKDFGFSNPPAFVSRQLFQAFRAYKAGAHFLAPKLPAMPIVQPEEDSDLIVAIKAGNIGEVEKLLQQGQSPDQLSTYFRRESNNKFPTDGTSALYGNTAVNIALNLKRYDIVHVLLEHGANPNIRSFFSLNIPSEKTNNSAGYYVAPLYAAVRYGAVDVVRDLVEHGANVNLASCTGGDVPLMAAANVEMAKLLVSLGADVNFKYANGSVLESFIRKDAEAKNIFAYLLDAGADPNMVVDSMPVLMKTMDKTLGDFSNMLIAHGAETDLRSDSGASFARSFGVYSGNPSFTKTGRKNSPREQLLQSIAWGEYSFVEGILDAQLDKVKDLLNTALWQAAKRITVKNWDIPDAHLYSNTLRLLIDKGADPKVPDEQGNTLLHFANDPDIISFLIANGINANAVNKAGESALEFAAKNGLIDKAAALVINGANTSEAITKHPDFMKAVDVRINERKVFAAKIEASHKKLARESSDIYLASPQARKYQRQLMAYHDIVASSEAVKAENEKPFNEETWQKLVDINGKSPCVKDRSVKCLLGQLFAMKMRDARRIIPSRSYISKNAQADSEFIDAVINHGDEATASKVLSILAPSADNERMLLQFLTGDYEAAWRVLRQLQEDETSGTDYGAVWALEQRGDIDEALNVTRVAIEWKYTDPTAGPAGLHSYTHSGFCIGNISSAYPRSIGLLANKFADAKNYEKSYEIVNMLKLYSANGLNGRGYFNCNWKAAKWAYEDAAFGLAEALVKDGKTERAKALFSEIQSAAKNMGIDLLEITDEMKNDGLEKEALAIALPPDQKKLREPDIKYSEDMRDLTDDVAFALALSGDYAQAITKLDGLSAYPNVRLNTFFKLAQTAVADGKTKEVTEIFAHLSQILGGRTSDLDNALDYIDFAGLLFDAGEKEQSKSALQMALKVFNDAHNNDYKRLEFGGKAMLLFVKLGNYDGMEGFMAHNAIDYNSLAGSTFTNILVYFASHDRWGDFDSFVARYMGAFKEKGGGEFHDVFYVRENLGSILIDKRQFDRYLKLTELADPPEAQYYKFQNLVVAGLQKDSAVPEALFADMWTRTLRGCKSRPELTAEKKMAGCYLGLIGMVQDRTIFSKTRGGVYVRSGY
ncbi:MAG: ankyrin repeat domain-containing protein [Micavibrio sp.]|nr:ankyrin repeat domain-containing protein [Micavibrio sp.]